MTSYIYDMVDTWNAGATTFTAVKMNVTDTASASGSLLMDLQVDGSSRFNVGKTGSLKLGVNPTGTNQAGTNVTIAGSQGTGTGAGGSIVFQVAPAGSSGTAQNALATALTIGGDRRLSFPDGTFIINDAPTGASNQIGIWAGGVFGLNRGGGNASQIVLYANGVSGLVLNGGTSGGAAPYLSFASPTAGTHDTFITRDDANKLALRNGANAQTFRVYNTTDGTNSEFGKIAWSSNVLQIGTEKAGTGTARALEFQTDGTTRLTISTAGNATVTGWIKSNLYFDAPAALLGGNGGIYFGTAGANGSQVQSTGAGVIALGNYGGSDFNRIQFGGTTSSFPALKRSSSTLQARLADDSAFASVQGKLTTDTAYAAGDPTTTGYLVVYDSTGTAYKIPAVAV